MISLVYLVDPTEAEAEKRWLNNMQVFPACSDYVDWSKNKIYTRFGVIVPPDAALTIKLRHSILLQQEYRRR